MNSVKKNFTYNIVYQILILIIPLITAPYISRVIGAEGQGIYSYTYSIAQYFVLFAMLGLNNYGNRTIAKIRDDKEKLSKEFWSIYGLQIITTTIMLILYITYIIFLDSSYKLYNTIQLVYVFSAMFDINWFFFGMEKFKLTVIRNTIIKILSACSIFIFVKSKNDLVLYMLIMVGAPLISQLSLWTFLRKYIFFVKPTWNSIKKHIKPNAILFVPVIAVSIYKMMDKIMLGNMSNISNVGYYENAEKIINIPNSIITALGTVMLPRMSNLVANGNNTKIEQYINKSMKFILFLSVPIAFGLIAIGKNFAPLFFGENFVKTGEIIQYLAITLVFISWANVIRTQYLIPNEKDKSYIISVFLGAIINFVINSLLIPKYNAIGAAIGTIFAEMVVMIYQTYTVRKELSIKKYFKYLLKFLVSALIMYLIIIQFERIIENKYILIFTQIMLGALIYFTINYKYILENIKEIIHKKRKIEGNI